MLQYLITATAMSTLLFAIIFLILSIRMERYYMRFWGFTLCGYGLMYVIDFFMFASDSTPIYLSFHILVLIVCANLFFAGTCNFFNVPFPRILLVVFVVSVLLSAAGMSNRLCYELFMIPLILYATMMLACTGLMFTLYAWTPKVPEKYIVSFGIIFWSVYNSNLPFRSDYLPVVISNYALGLCLLNTMVILLLIIHFKKGRFQIARQEAHYRMLVENAAGAVLLYNHGEMRFQYVSPSVLEETGHSAEELTRDPFALLQGLAGDAVEQVRRLLKAPPQEATNLIYSRETAGGQTDWYELHASPVLDNAAFPVGVECVISNITDRMKLLDDLKRSEEARKNLIEDVSHELRTPITIIQGYTETLLDETPPGMNNVYLEIIHAKTQTLNTLLEDLIQASNFSSQQVEYKFYEIFASAYFNRALNENRLRLEQEGRAVCCQNNLPGGLVIVIDHYRIDQVIANLLSNALKFTATGDTISMYCDMNIEPATPEPQADSASSELRFDLPPGKITVRISDTGRGIPPESLPHIFKRKYTGANQPRENGFGLGLYISREIIRQHGGQIWAENNPDCGVSLYFSLPCYFKAEEAHSSKHL